MPRGTPQRPMTGRQRVRRARRFARQLVRAARATPNVLAREVVNRVRVRNGLPRLGHRQRAPGVRVVRAARHLWRMAPHRVVARVWPVRRGG
jgi:hypothetical protein